MGETLRRKWMEIGDTDVYSSGYYLVTTGEAKQMIREGELENGEKLERLEEHTVITTRLMTDYRVSFHFFPYNRENRYLMEGLASSRALDHIQEILPPTVKNIIKNRISVRYYK